MGNFCSIFHVRFKHLMKVIPSARKAQLVDYILLGWQTSTYKLKGSDKKWFMKPYAEIVEDTGIPKSTLERYIKELVEEGFIERRQALYSRTKEQGGFEVKKGTYIHITDKLLALLKLSQKPDESSSSSETHKHHLAKQSHSQDNHPDMDNKQPKCMNLLTNEGNGSLKMRELYISDLYSTYPINTISFKQSMRSVDKSTQQRLIQQFQSIQNLLTTEIKEEIPEPVKQLVLGTFFNLTFEQHKQFSLPQQIVAEYLYALINTEFYMPDVTCFKHRNNILAKTIRSNQWRTPKGFYNHFYLGQSFKDKDDLREQHWQEQKEQEINRLTDEIFPLKDERLVNLEAKMLSASNQIEKLTQDLYGLSCETMIGETRERIRLLRQELEELWRQQLIIEQENERVLQMKRCA